jgi:hypothetical protein
MWSAVIGIETQTDRTLMETKTLLEDLACVPVPPQTLPKCTFSTADATVQLVSECFAFNKCACISKHTIPTSCIAFLSSTWGNGGLNIAVLAGWTNVLLFGANIWFVYKETPWFFDSKVMSAHSQSSVVDASGGGFAAPYESGTTPPPIRIPPGGPALHQSHPYANNYQSMS